jgi:Flp pilus assembly protein TadG
VFLMKARARWTRFQADRGQEGGYVAVLTALLLTVLIGLAAFAVDVGHWYVVGQQEQRAADAAALAGVTSLPADSVGAFAAAQNYAKINGFQNGVKATVVTPGVDGDSTRLRVTISQTVTNFFGSLMGRPTTKIGRTAVADYIGPVPLGSPCNGFGNDPDPSASANRAATCTTQSQFWANIGSLGQNKSNGDAYQDSVCAAGVDGCSGSTNTDLDPAGYTYTVTVTQPVSNLKIQAFDPAQIAVGDHCNNSNDSAGNDQAKLAAAASLPLSSVVVTDPSARYAPGDGSWCTGDRNGTPGGALNQTRFTIHGVGTNPWDPVSWPLQGSCGTAPGTAVVGALNPKTFDPFVGDLSKALDKTILPAGQAGKFMPKVAANFRQWVDLCTISGTVQPGTYAIQVETSVPGGAGGHNRFGLRAFGSNSSDKDFISVAGFDKMAIFANFAGTTQFFLARVPSAAAGQTLNVGLFDVGDSPTTGTITLLKPAESATSFSNCVATGTTAALTKALPTCSFTVNSTDNQGKWQNVAVPIPSTYACSDGLTSGCWVMLQYAYGASNPADATSWRASIQGDPVRLVE